MLNINSVYYLVLKYKYLLIMYKLKVIQLIIKNFQIKIIFYNKRSKEISLADKTEYRYITLGPINSQPPD